MTAESARLEIREDAATTEKILGALCLANKARKVTVGANLCIADSERSALKLAVISDGTSGNTMEKLLRSFESNSVPYIVLHVSAEILAKRLGKSGFVAVAAINGGGFENIIYKAIRK